MCRNWGEGDLLELWRGELNWNWGEGDLLELGRGGLTGTGERIITGNGERIIYWNWGEEN